MRARSVILAALGAAFMLSATAPGFADDRDHDHHRPPPQDFHHDWDRDWHRGYVPPPVVVAPPPYGYYSPPVYAPSPGLSIGINIP